MGKEMLAWLHKVYVYVSMIRQPYMLKTVLSDVDYELMSWPLAVLVEVFGLQALLL